jgi:hypothetical protein
MMTSRIRLLLSGTRIPLYPSKWTALGFTFFRYSFVSDISLHYMTARKLAGNRLLFPYPTGHVRKWVSKNVSDTAHRVSKTEIDTFSLRASIVGECITGIPWDYRLWM